MALGGEDPHDVGAAPDLFVQSFLGVVGPDLTPMGFGEPGERQDLSTGLVEMIRGVDESSFGEVADDTVVLGPHLIRVGLGEYGTHHGGDHRPGAFRHLGQ